MEANKFVTNDLDLSALLQTCGVRLVDVKRNDDRRAEFVFDERERCEELRRRFVVGDIEANALQLLRSLRQLKYSLHNCG